MVLDCGPSATVSVVQQWQCNTRVINLRGI